MKRGSKKAEVGKDRDLCCNLCDHKFSVGEGIILHFVNKHPRVINEFREMKELTALVYNMLTHYA